jgi:hypothetical protein
LSLDHQRAILYSGQYWHVQIKLCGGMYATDQSSHGMCAIYNVANATWLPGQPQLADPVHHAGYCANPIDPSEMLIVGGRHGGNGIQDTVRSCQRHGLTSVGALGPCPPPLWPVGGVGTCVSDIDGRVWVCGSEVKNEDVAPYLSLVDFVPKEGKDGGTISNCQFLEGGVWREVPGMPGARHGISPASHGMYMYVAGGAPLLGTGQSGTAWRARLDELAYCAVA